MREILFRGKRKDDGKWVEGHYHFANWYITPSREVVDTTYYILQIGHGDADEIDPNTVGQFTGLTDKNGKKIFEGDVGRYKQTDGAKQNGDPIICIGKVVYNAKTGSYAVESKDKTGCKYFDYFPIKDFEVIGNIHDNPELLEVR